MLLSSVAPLLLLSVSSVVVETAVTGCHGGRDIDHRPRQNCTAAGFDHVPPGIEPSTQVLLFPLNQFSEFSWSSFTVFKDIYEIDLSHNQISVLPKATPQVLPSLSVLHLGSNLLRAVPDHSFSGSPALTKLFLNNSLLSSLTDLSFSGLSKLEILDLSNNHIQTLPARMMFPLSAIKALYLEGNKIKEMPNGWFSKKEEVPYLYLSANPWACHCSLGYLRWYLGEYEYNVYVRQGPIIMSDVESVMCDSPESLKGQSVFKLEESDFCGGPTSAVPEHTPDPTTAIMTTPTTTATAAAMTTTTTTTTAAATTAILTTTATSATTALPADDEYVTVTETDPTTISTVESVKTTPIVTISDVSTVSDVRVHRKTFWWLVGGWETEQGTGLRGSWRAWLGQFLSSMPRRVSAPPRSEAECEERSMNEDKTE